MPLREWSFAFRESRCEFRELLREYPGTLRGLREGPFHSESVFPEIGVVSRLLTSVRIATLSGILPQELSVPWSLRLQYSRGCGDLQPWSLQASCDVEANLAMAPLPTQGLPGPFRPGTPEDSEKSPERPRRRTPKVLKKCAPESQTSPKRVRSLAR